MPGSDDQYDQVHTYSQDHAGKSKTTKPAVREIGRDGAPVQLYVGQDVDPSTLRTPPANTRFLFFNQNGNPRVKNPDGSIDTFGGGAPTDASYVTTASESTLSNETVFGTALNVDALGSSVSSVQDVQTDSSGNVTTSNTPVTHASTHEDGGADELSVQGLSGDLADAQDPKAHASSHGSGGTDTIDAGDLGGSSGSAGQFLRTDGTAATWADPPGGTHPFFHTFYTSINSTADSTVYADAVDAPIDTAQTANTTFRVVGQSNTGNTAECQLDDATNTNTIASVSTTSTSIVELDDTTFQNIPSSRATLTLNPTAGTDDFLVNAATVNMS